MSLLLVALLATASAEDGVEARTIKTLQPKSVLKMGRSEISPHVGWVTNDPFVERRLIGASYTHHLTEIFAAELSFTYSPDFGEGDWTDLTRQLVNENRVSPDISKIQYFGSASLQFAPFYGKIAISGDRIIHFDLFGAFGVGSVNTRDTFHEDDLDESTVVEFHATTNYGGGARVMFSDTFAVRLEGRSLAYIETVNDLTLEMKNNFLILGSASFFFPRG
jgi:outer membrane beta-barrel protein